MVNNEPPKTAAYSSSIMQKIVSMIRKIPQSQTADEPGRQTKQSSKLSLPNQDDCKTRMDIK